MKPKYIRLGLLALAFLLAINLIFQPFSFLLKERSWQIQSAQAEVVNTQNFEKKNRIIYGSLAKLNENFQIKMYQRAVVASDNIAVEFRRVTEDSRCPKTLLCMWQGQALVVVNIAVNGQNVGEFTLKSSADSPSLAVKTFSSDSTIKLIDLQPYPSGSTPINQSDYIATLVVSKT